MESHQQEPQNDETPNKILETAADDRSPLPSPPITAPPQTSGSAVDGGEDPRDVNPSSSEISDLEKKQRRAERFGMSVQLSEEEKRSSRAERFGTASISSGKNDPQKLEEDKRKARAERFGLTAQTPVDEEAKKKARLDRFAANPIPVTTEEEEKRKARALRFSGTSNATSETNGKVNPELEAADAETKGEA